jgi:hypothetical protein
MPTRRTPAFLADHRPSTRPLALTTALVMDATDGTVRPAAVVVRDGRIVDVVDDPRAAPTTRRWSTWVAGWCCPG